MFALFKKKSDDGSLNDNEEILNFENTIINTKDLPVDLERIAKKYSLNQKELDFKILGFKSYYQEKSSKKIVEINNTNKEQILTQENLLNPDIKFFQELRVEVYLKKKSGKFPLPMSIGANSNFTQIRANFKAKESISYFDGLEEEIIGELNKRKAKLGILIGMMDEKMHDSVKKLTSIIRVNGSITQNTSFNICEGIEPINGSKVELIEHYKQKQVGSDANNPISMYGVKEGDLVLELVKAKESRYGRNCKGEILGDDQVELSNSDIEINVSEEEFEIKEDEERILYYAKRGGYINEAVGNRYEIRDEFVVDSVSVKSTGDIAVGEEGDVTVVIKEDNSVLDAVGPGVEIETSELDIAGSVANNAKIKANKAQIKGQTHQSSRICANELQIHLHKGYAEGNIVEINILEGGTVIGDIVRVEKFSGGEIRAKEVYIKNVVSNSKVTASHHIEIDKIEGNGNVFVVDARAQRDFESKFEALSSKLKELELKLVKLPKELKQKKRKIESEKENIAKINQTIEEMKKFGKTPLASLVLKLKEHQERIKSFNSLLKELKDVKMEKENLNQELVDLNTSVLNAKVICKSPWKEFNEVKFKLIKPPVEVSFLPKEGEKTEVLSLASTEEGEYNISREG